MSVLQNINIHGLLHRHHTIIMAPAVRGIQKPHQFGHHCRHYLHHRENIERSFKNICRPDNSRNLCQVLHAVSQQSEVGRGEGCRVIVQLSGSVIVGMRSEGAGGSKVRPGVRLMSSHHAITPPQHTQTGASRFNSSSTWLSQPILHASFEEGHLKFSETSDKDDVDLSNPNSQCFHQQIHTRQNKARRKSKSWAKPSD